MRVSRSGYGLGVSLDNERKTRRFRARVFHHGRINLGRFSTAHEARLAYDQAVRALGGAGHATNYPAGQFEFFDPKVAEKVHQHLNHLDVNDSDDDDDDGEGGEGGEAAAAAAAGGGAAAAVGGAGLGSEGGAGAVNGALAAVADDSMEMPQAGPDSNTVQAAAAAVDAGAASPVASPAPAPHAAARLQGVQQLLPLQPFAGAASSASQQQQQAAIRRMQGSNRQLLALAPAEDPHIPEQWAGAAEAHARDRSPELADLVADYLAEDNPQAGFWPAAAAAAAQQPQVVQPQQQHPEQQQYPEDISEGSDGSDRSSSGSGRYTSNSNPAAAAAAPGTPGAAGRQQAAPVADIPYIKPTMSSMTAALRHLKEMQQHQEQQQRPPAPAPMFAGDMVSCVDMTLSHLTQLYARLTAQPLQHAGHTAVTWLAGVRAHSTALLGSNGAAAAQVYCAAMHICACLVSIAADLHAGAAAVGSFSSSYLMVVLELLMQALLSLRALCAGLPPGQQLGNDTMQGWRQELQGQARTRGGQAVAKVLAFL